MIVAPVPIVCSAGAAYFVPISIGNLYYSRARIEQIRDRFLANADASMILVCDSLRYFAYLARRDMTEQTASDKAEREAAELERMLHNAGIADLASCAIARLSAFCALQDFQTFVERFARTFDDLDDVNNEIDRLTLYYLSRYYNTPNAHSRSVQGRNVILAASISIYCTELLGYSKELYKQVEGGLQPFLYAHHPHRLRWLLGKETLERHFISLIDTLD